MGIPWRTFEDIERRLAELERKVAYLYGHAGLEPPPPPDPHQPSSQVLAFVAEGKTIEAIQQYRADTGLGLADAKRAIDELRGEQAAG
jgi:large subunit ribosomal protein L7/L12